MAEFSKTKQQVATSQNDPIVKSGSAPGFSPAAHSFIDEGQRGNAPAASKGAVYQVKPGDTLYSIARKANVPLDVLLRANPELQPEKPLKIDSPIHLPGAVQHSHKIVPGDSLFKIAERYKISLALLRQANPQVDPRKLRIGDELLLPSRRESESAPPQKFEPQLHKVSRGETLYAIAARYRVKLEDLLSANPSLSPKNVRIGERISIPGDNPARHQVAKGETLESIAKAYHLRTSSMLEANPADKPASLQIGQELAVPQLSARERRDLEKMRSYVGQPYGVKRDCMSMVMDFARSNYGLKLPGGRSDLWVPYLEPVTTITKDRKDISALKTGNICCIGHPYRGSISVYHNVLVAEPIHDKQGRVIDFTAIDAHGNYINGDRSRPFGKVREIPSLLGYLSNLENSRQRSHAFVMRIPLQSEADGF